MWKDNAYSPGISNLGSKWFRLAKKRDKSGNFSDQILSIIGLGGLNSTEIWSEKIPDLFHFQSIWPTLGQNLTPWWKNRHNSLKMAFDFINRWWNLRSLWQTKAYWRLRRSIKISLTCSFTGSLSGTALPETLKKHLLKLSYEVREIIDKSLRRQIKKMNQRNCDFI